MSWEDYPKSLVDSGKMSKALVGGHDGLVYAESEKFMTKDEIKNLLEVFDEGDVTKHVMIDKKKYYVIQITPRSIYAKGKEGDGFCMVKTTKTVLVGFYEKEKYSAGHCNFEVEKMADYLIENGC
jgi:hypothetical protein